MVNSLKLKRNMCIYIYMYTPSVLIGNRSTTFPPRNSAHILIVFNSPSPIFRATAHVHLIRSDKNLFFIKFSVCENVRRPFFDKLHSRSRRDDKEKFSHTLILFYFFSRGVYGFNETKMSGNREKKSSVYARYRLED